MSFRQLYQFTSHEINGLEVNMSSKVSRKEFLVGATGLLAAAGTIAVGQQGSHHEGSHHEGSHHEGSHGRASKSQSDLTKVALECVQAGQECIQHCLEHFKRGDTTMADCAASVNEMNVFCTALSELFSFKSKRLAAFAEVCAQSCRDCEKECRKHEKTHPICKRCADACVKCIEHCNRA